MGNKLKQLIAEGKKPFGTFFESGSTNITECLGKTGLDFIIIDNEHGPFDVESTLDFIRGAELTGLTPMVRVREISRPAILKQLDIGAKGLIVPCVETVEQVEQLVEYAKFAPIGKRGFCPTRKDIWGFAYPGTAPMEENMAACNMDTLLIPQCETTGCLENIEAIAAMEGVDGIFVGPFDLSISMGIPGQFTAPHFLEAIERILKACKENGKLSIIFTGNLDAVKGYYEQGFDMVTYSLDTSVLINAYREISSKAKA